MNWLDVVIIIALVGSAISGLINGLIKSLLSFIGLILGIILAGRYYIDLANVLSFISNETAAKIVAFIIIFVVILMVASVLGVLLTKVISAIRLEWLNRLLGTIFGVLQGALFIGAILALVVKFGGSYDAITGSALAQFLLDRFPVVLSLLPGDFNSIQGFFH